MLTIILITGIVILAVVLWKYQRQMKDICRQIAFLREHDSNMLITTQIRAGGVGELAEELNELLLEMKSEHREYMEKEGEIARIYTDLSHDIRTPLTSLDGYFQLLRETRDPEEQERYIRIIQERIGSLKEMLEELFTYTRLQDADYELETGRIDFGKCAYDTVFSFYDEFQNRGIEPQVDFCGGHLFVRANDEAVRRALQNLIRNALVHGHTGISLELFEENWKAVFRCSNDVAHPEEIDIERVFSRFYKADSARTHTSTGLGLSIAKGLVERMDGEIRAELEGERFVVEILFDEADVC